MEENVAVIQRLGRSPTPTWSTIPQSLDNHHHVKENQSILKVRQTFVKIRWINRLSDPIGKWSVFGCSLLSFTPQLSPCNSLPQWKCSTSYLLHLNQRQDSRRVCIDCRANLTFADEMTRLCAFWRNMQPSEMWLRQYIRWAPWWHVRKVWNGGPDLQQPLGMRPFPAPL
jgi:hypothetical protein